MDGQRLVRFTKDETDNTPSSFQQRAASTPWQMALLSAETNTATYYCSVRDPNLSKPSFQSVRIDSTGRGYYCRSRNTCEGLQCFAAAQRWQLVLRSDYHYLLQRGGQRHIAAHAIRAAFAVSQHTTNSRVQVDGERSNTNMRERASSAFAAIQTVTVMELDMSHV